MAFIRCLYAPLICVSNIDGIINSIKANKRIIFKGFALVIKITGIKLTKIYIASNNGISFWRAISFDIIMGNGENKY